MLLRLLVVVLGGAAYYLSTLSNEFLSVALLRLYHLRSRYYAGADSRLFLEAGQCFGRHRLDSIGHCRGRKLEIAGGGNCREYGDNWMRWSRPSVLPSWL